MKAAKEWLAERPLGDCDGDLPMSVPWPTEDWIHQIQIETVREVGERLIGVKCTPEAIGVVFRQMLAEMQGT